MNWTFGFACGVLMVLALNRIYDDPTVAHSTTDHESVIAAYNRGSSDVLKMNPIDPRLESTCLQLWGMKQ